jgi:hypothetical protein
VVDIESSTTRTNVTRGRLREAMYHLLEKALRESGIAEQHHDPLIDRGDGALVLLHPVDQVPKTLLLNVLIPALNVLLADHNENRPEHQFRLRAGVHSGEVHYDSHGPFGEAIDVTCRLVDAPEVKAKLAKTTAPMVMAVSDDIYRSVIRHGYDGIDARAFEPLVRLTIGGDTQRGWVHIPSVPTVTNDVLIDTLLHRAGQELDTRATIRSLDAAAVVDRILQNEAADQHQS